MIIRRNYPMDELKPKTKSMWVPYVNEDGSGVSVGGFQPGIAKLLETESPNELLTFLSFCDGKHSISDLTKKFKLTKKEAANIIQSLFDVGILYIDECPHTIFSQDEKEYYSRNLNFFAWIDTDAKYQNYWDTQAKLKQANILVLGCGGTGSECAISLARLGVGSITLVDYDTVSLNNLNRQNYSFYDIGKEKGLVLKQIINQINPFINVSYYNKKIESTSDIIEIGYNYDLLICCIDKPQNINVIIEEYTNYTDTPRIIGGYASTVITVGLFLKTSPQFSKLMNESLASSYDAYMVSQNTQWEWENAIIAPVAKMAGNLSALFAMYYLTGLRQITDGAVLHLDLFNLQNEHAIYSFGAETNL